MRAIVLTIWMLSLPASLAAQDDRLARIRTAFPADVADRIETILAEADAAKVPVAPLLDKALEGAAKAVPPERVVGALGAYAERLSEARGLVGADRGPDAVVAAADAVRRGVPPTAVRSLAGDHPGELAIPLVVLGDLVEAGVPVTGARDVLGQALTRRTQAEQLLAIPGAVRRLVREGRNPDEAARTIAGAFAAGHLPPGVPAGNLPGLGLPAGPPVPPGAGPPDGAGPPGKKPPVDPPVDPPGGP